MTGVKPAFTWIDGTVVTLTYVNKILETMLGQEKPKITKRAFRPALPTILTREPAMTCSMHWGGGPQILSLMLVILAGASPEIFRAGESSEDKVDIEAILAWNKNSTPA